MSGCIREKGQPRAALACSRSDTGPPPPSLRCMPMPKAKSCPLFQTAAMASALDSCMTRLRPSFMSIFKDSESAQLLPHAVPRSFTPSTVKLQFDKPSHVREELSARTSARAPAPSSAPASSSPTAGFCKECKGLCSLQILRKIKVPERSVDLQGFCHGCHSSRSQAKPT